MNQLIAKMSRRKKLFTFGFLIAIFAITIKLSDGQVVNVGTGLANPIANPGAAVALSEEDLERLEREKTKNVVRLAATDQLNSEIITNRTRGE